jgi:hypothetical protein
MKDEHNEEMSIEPPFFLSEIYHVPFSMNHHKEVFSLLLNNGLLKLVKIHCLQIKQESFEKMLNGYPILIEEHLDFYSNSNEYWLGRDIMDDEQIEIYLILRGDLIQWFFLHLIFETNH